MTGVRAALSSTVAALLAVTLVGCADVDADPSSAAVRSVAPTLKSPAPVAESARASESASAEPESSQEPEPAQEAEPAPEPRRSYLSIPALGMDASPVVRYRGTPDDAEGTRIQNDGPMASPRGRGGGVGPGEVGNFIITGHRLSATKPFLDLPSLERGDRVRVRSGDRVFVYEITGTRQTSFRSRRSLAEQAAAVPGRPGATPTEAMITLSTCATPEDHAVGNYWSDEFGNPEHRIDKIGVLVEERPAR